jgi:phosphoribosylformylglycinamidine synthase
VDTVHDCSDGGLLVTLAEMAMAGRMGARLALADASIPALYGEDQARYVLAVPTKTADAILVEAKKTGVPASSIGAVGGDKIALGGGELPVAGLRAAHESWFRGYMAGEEIPPTN